MSVESAFVAMMQMDDSKIINIFIKTARAYMKILYAIADDIYDSCIKDYYNGYVPLVYTRHGNIGGENLYRAKSNSLSGGKLIIDTDAGKLMPYSGKNGGTSRSTVLSGVMDGLRGGPGIEGWPRNWYTSYPNSYSSYGFWQSNADTIDEIMQDFADNVLDDTEDIFWELLIESI